MTDFTGGPGFLAFVFTFALAIGAVLLFRSLSKHLRKVKGQSSTSSDLSDHGRPAADGAGEGTAAASEDASEPKASDGGPDQLAP